MHEIARADGAWVQARNTEVRPVVGLRVGVPHTDLGNVVLLTSKLGARLVGMGDYWWPELSAVADIESPTRRTRRLLTLRVTRVVHSQEQLLAIGLPRTLTFLFCGTCKQHHLSQQRAVALLSRYILTTVRGRCT